MIQGVLLAVASTAFLAPAAASADPNGLLYLTREANETLVNVDKTPHVGAVPAPRVTVAWKVTVSAGGRAGIVRPVFGGVMGDPVTLPAEPGTYTFPMAPHVRTGGWVGLFQTTGGHAIIDRTGCHFEAQEWDDAVCRLRRIEEVNILNVGDIVPDIPGAQLRIEPVSEPDADQDLLGDLTEDRANLRVTAAPAREPDGRLRIVVTVSNIGHEGADLPVLQVAGVPAGRWEGDCSGTFPACGLPPLAPGASRTLTLRSDAPDLERATVSVAAEGPDYAPEDNTRALKFAAAPRLSISAATGQRIARGVTVGLRGSHTGKARVTAAFTVGSRTITEVRTVTLQAFHARALTLHPNAAKRRAIRRAAPVTARITVQTPGEADAVSATTKVS
jgi:hypothetical protein